MTRAEWVQRAILGYMATPTNPPAMFDFCLMLATRAADDLEKSGAAPWDGDERDICGGSEHCPGCAGCIPRQDSVKSEREACAKIIDGAFHGEPKADLAAKIRARGTR